MDQQNTIFITGGHVTPAIAVIEEIRRQKLPWRIIFVGRKNALEGQTSVSAEHDEIVGMRISFLPLVAGRLTRILTPLSFGSLMKIPFGFLQAFWYVLSNRPKLVISFGGYVALPVVVAAVCFGIPVVTHEQTMRLGLANRIIGFIARKIFISFPGVSLGKTVVTGLPLRQELFYPPARPSFYISKNKPVLYITGGSTGSVSLNERLAPCIETLLSRWHVIHQTGKQSYKKGIDDMYITAPYFQTRDVAWIYKHADLIISRAGANTVWELATLGKVALLIPLPWSAGGEQLVNARWFAAKGSAVVLEQKNATPEKLNEVLNDMMKKKAELLTAAKRLKTEMPTDGAKRMVDEIATMVAA